jgi:biopolymer transport protein ExbD
MNLNRKRKNVIISEINITPFTDVVLVLLVIFMITTPILIQPGIKVNLPKVQSLNNKFPSNIEVLISQNGNIYIGGKQVYNTNVENAMRNLIFEHPDKAIVIKADRAVKYNYVIQFMDKAKKAGATKFALAVDNVKI